MRWTTIRQQLAVIAILLFSSSFLFSSAAKAQGQYSKPSDIPAEAFAALPQVSNLQQSPTGEKVAFMSSIEGRKVMIVQNLDGSDRYIQPPIGEADIFNFRWANDERLLVMYELTLTRGQYVNFRNTETRLAAVNADGSDFEWVVRASKMKSSASGRNAKEDVPMWQTDIIDMLPDEPNHILLSLDGDFNNQSEIRRIDIRNGRFRELEDGFRGVQSWKTDRTGEPRFGWGVWRQEKTAYWKNNDGGWVQVTNQDWYSKYPIFGFADDGEHMLVSASADNGKTGVYKLHVETGQIVDEVFSHPDVDIDYVRYDRSYRRVVGVGFTDDMLRFHYLDRRRAGLMRAMRKALPNYELDIVDFDHENGRYLLAAYSDREPGSYFQYDRIGKKLVQVASSRPNMPADLMASTRKIGVTTQDGSEIPAYLTLPVGAAQSNLPAIVLVHGGPWTRDTAEWDYWTQFLASRGYAVLRPNFRGSSGYGPEFQRAGYQQWGGLMQRDVEDATKQLIDDGTFDPDRVCIAGASYGGYAAMMGLIQSPELYQCGVSVNGALNLPRLKSADSTFWGSSNWLSRVGLKDHNLEDVSPFHQVKKISRPALVMASKDDTRLRIVDSENFYSRLKDASPESEYVEIEDGGHSMDTAASRLTKLKAMEAFLAKHIGE